MSGHGRTRTNCYSNLSINFFVSLIIGTTTKTMKVTRKPVPNPIDATIQMIDDSSSSSSDAGSVGNNSSVFRHFKSRLKPPHKPGFPIKLDVVKVESWPVEGIFPVRSLYATLNCDKNIDSPGMEGLFLSDCYMTNPASLCSSYLIRNPESYLINYCVSNPKYIALSSSQTPARLDQSGSFYSGLTMVESS